MTDFQRDMQELAKMEETYRIIVIPNKKYVSINVELFFEKEEYYELLELEEEYNIETLNYQNTERIKPLLEKAKQIILREKNNE